jgi:hypothetical protein
VRIRQKESLSNLQFMYHFLIKTSAQPSRHAKTLCPVATPGCARQAQASFHVEMALCRRL